MTWRVALSGDFLRPDGAPAYPDFDVRPLEACPGIELSRSPARPAIMPEDTAGLDAPVLLAEGFGASSIGAAILRAPNVIAAPHALSWTHQGFAAIGAACVAAVQAARRGEAPAPLANPEVLRGASRFRRRSG